LRPLSAELQQLLVAAKKQAIKLEDCAATADTLRTLVDRVELRWD